MFGGVWAAAETRKVLGALGARVLEDTVTLPKAHERLADGVDEALAPSCAPSCTRWPPRSRLDSPRRPDPASHPGGAASGQNAACELIGSTG